MIGPLLEIVSSILKIWAKKIDRKYIDRLDELSRELRTAENSPDDSYNAALVDNLRSEVIRTLRAIEADAKKDET